MNDNPESIEEEMKEAEEVNWLQLAREAYSGSTDWLDSNVRNQLERNLALFQSRHPNGSKYHTDAYKHRSKGFRPKTRSFVRQNEAAAAAAFFSTEDVAYAEAVNDQDERQQASAEINTELLKYRLDKSIKWFLTCVGAYQDADVSGVAIAHVHWEYEDEEEDELTPVYDALGNPLMDDNNSQIHNKSTKITIKKDRPAIDLIPFENFRIDPSANWLDPINTSPYVIEILPMYIGEALEQMEVVDSKTGQPKWHSLTKEELMSSRQNEYDSIRQARQDNRQDPESNTTGTIAEYETVWIHRNIIRKDGRDWVYYTAGTQFMLSDPVPLEEVYLHGIRPYVMGYTVLEAHKAYPSSMVELGQDLQTEANDLRNQRFDNVKLVLNKRYHVKRGANVDLGALQRNTPGGGVMMDDIKAVETIHTPDVTASSYNEQDRLNVDFDDLVGSFSQSTIQTNRNMNETVGGMQLASGSSNQMKEYGIRLFSITFVEQVMSQLVQLEQAYETDAVILALAGDKAKIYQKYGIDKITDAILKQDLTVRVNVGVDSTDPVKRLDKFFYGLERIGNMRPELIARIKDKELIKEIFGKLGYKDGGRFFDGINDEQDPALLQAQQTIQQLQGIIEGKQVEEQGKTQSALKLAQFNAQSERDREILKIEGDIRKIQEQGRIDQSKLAGTAAAEAALQRDGKIADLNKEITKIHESAMVEVQKERAILNEQSQSEVNKILLQQEKAYALQEPERMKEEKITELSQQLADISAALEQLATSHVQQAQQTPKIANSVRQISDYQKAAKSIIRDKDGKPVGVKVEGYGIQPVKRDANGDITGVGE